MNRAHELFIQGIRKVNDFMISTDTGSIMAGMESAKNEFMTVVKFAVNIIAVPVIAVIIGVILLFNVAACVRKHNGQQSYSDKLTVVIICLVVLVLVVSFPFWGWQMLGVTTSTPTATDTAAAASAAAAYLGGFFR